MFEIEKDVPPPAAKENASYKFERLAVGDSIFVPSTVALLPTTANRLRWAVKKYRRTHAPLTKWRTATKVNGIRVWRLS
jgi:hypothetical protein